MQQGQKERDFTRYFCGLPLKKRKKSRSTKKDFLELTAGTLTHGFK